jgi:hypothetical protein
LNDDIAVVWNGTNKNKIQIWDALRKDPIKRAVIVAVCSSFGRTQSFDSDIVDALFQNYVSWIHFHLLGVEGFIAKTF